MKTIARATETHQGFKNLDTFKFALHIDNTQSFYIEKIKLFKECFSLTEAQTKEKIKDFLKSKKSYVKEMEKDFYISLVDFDFLTNYLFDDYEEFKKEKLLEKEDVTAIVNIKRYFDRINGNSYFVYVISFNTDELIQYKSNYLEYGYGSAPEQEAKKLLNDIFEDKKYTVKFFDHGYFQTQKELKNFINS